MRPGQPTRVHWVATPPPGAQRQRPVHRAQRYLGPPSYPVPPRWGFPQVAWRWPTSVPGSATPTDLADRVRTQARFTSLVLYTLAGLAVVAAGGEVWRYVLLLQSRYGALDKGVVDTSDALVVTASVVTVLAELLAILLVLLWLYRARQVAAAQAGYRSSRSDRETLIGLVVPGVNLVVAGAVLAELEHAALRRPAEARPRPSRLVRLWWAAWAAGGLVLAGTLLWGLRGDVQSMADGVLLHAVADLCAAGVAVLTALVVRRVSELLTAVEPEDTRLMLVVSVADAPEPPLRAFRYAGSPR
ncbi:DUF4328 domain-containing protein [Solihabitans fulvus]|uniref:DUF4328 domain-containing protein n=1 Tax=Solihabitans fulvus TaxID=1892852 RepID=A0A5B2WAN3_9PSEU|nr:DUF4328 domain-containing protein [Solihabitans fulvus]KAA2248891.1 DUF4328 domain-containing protein [Solihabitans fulvus]